MTHETFHISAEDLGYIEFFTAEYFKACRSSDPPLKPHEGVVSVFNILKFGVPPHVFPGLV